MAWDEIIGQDLALVDFNSLIGNFVQMRSQADRQYKLHFEAPDFPVLLRLNESRIVQVLDNILNNAISFSPKHSTVKFVLNSLATDRTALLEIMDTGPGIPETKLEAVFDRFYSARPSQEEFGEHSGLGLSIARQIVDAHDGKLTAHNRPGGGACFRLALPMER